MNVPHWLAKRDAAYGGVLSLLDGGFLGVPTEERSRGYTRLMSLLNLALKSHERAIMGNDDSPDLIGDYLRLLKHIMHASSLIFEAREMVRRETGISSCFPAELSGVLNQTSASYIDSEAGLLESAVKLTAVAGQIFERDGCQTRKRLSQHDSDRYEEALKELRGIYRQLTLVTA